MRTLCSSLARNARIAGLSATLAALSAPAGSLAAEPAGSTAIIPLPTADRLGFWSPTQQEIGYRSMERIFPTHVIKTGKRVLPLPVARESLRVDYAFEDRPYTTDDFMKVNRVSGLLVIKDGKIRLERYALGRGPKDRWTSFSIAKSVTSTLLGAAVRDGSIRSIDDKVTAYVPALKGGAYDGVSLRQMLTMTSGVHWNEKYDDPASDFNRHAADMGPGFYKLMSAQPRDAAPGETFHYSTAESNLLGAAVMGATGKSLADYFSEKIWAPFGMESDAVWITSHDGLETGGICFSATLRDYGRLGLFMLGGGKAGGKDVLPAGWITEATRKQVATGSGGGYGYQWWIGEDGGYLGVGIMGQALYIDPDRNLVIVIQSAWPNAGTPQNYKVRNAYIKAVKEALAREAL